MLIKKLVKYKDWTIPSLGGLGWTEDYAQSCVEFNAEEIELYELWFEFMKRSTYSRWTRKVKHDFVNVSRLSKSAHIDMEFPKWWAGHNLHFAIASFEGIYEISDVEDYQYFKAIADDPQENMKIFAVAMDTPINVAKRQFADLLRAHRKVSGSPLVRRECDGNYPIHGAATGRYLPDKTMLWKILEVYDLKMYYEANGVRRFGWQIEEELTERRINSEERELLYRGLRFRMEVSPTTPGGETLNKYTWEDLGKERRRVQASTISRYFKQAKTIIANVERGIFPKWTE